MVDVARATPEDRARYVNAVADRVAAARLIDAHRAEYLMIRADAYREASETWDRLATPRSGRAGTNLPDLPDLRGPNAPPAAAASPSGHSPSDLNDLPGPADRPEPLSVRVRRWAAVHGVDCPRSGPVPRAVYAAWHAAHPDEPTPAGAVGGPRGAPRPVARPESIREWHRRTRCPIPCSPAGRIPYAVVDAWRAANPDAPRQPCEDAMEAYRAKEREHPPAPVERPVPAAAASTPPDAPRPVPRPAPGRPASSPAAAQPSPRVTPPRTPQRPATAPTGPDATGPRLCGCGVRLSRYNPDDRCSACTVKDEAAARASMPEPDDDDLDTFGDDDGPVAAGPPRKDRSGDYDHPQRERRRVPRPTAADGRVVLSDGTVNPLAPHEVRRDEAGRVICGACGEYISTWLACGCDPGFVDDDGHPLDPRYADMTVDPDTLESPAS